MKRWFSIITLLMPAMLFAQTYNSLWKQAKDAQDKDLPQTEQNILKLIIKKAEKEKNYGQLLKAELTQARSKTAVAPDSLKSAVERLVLREQQAEGNHTLQAVYDAVLAWLYEQGRTTLDDAVAQAKAYKQKAMSHPQELAAIKATDYAPFVVMGSDSNLFADDLLSVIAAETEQYDIAHQYYLTTDNRRAQLLTALPLIDQERRAEQLDSLIGCYADLTECGEAAIMRYNELSSNPQTTARQKMDYIDDALSHWGQWKRMDILRNARNVLTQQQFRAQLAERVGTTATTQQLKVDFLRGINELDIRLYRVNANGAIELDPMNQKDYRELKPLLSLMKQEKRTYSQHEAYDIFKDSISMDALPVGVYMLELESKPATTISRQLFYVSDVRVLAQPLPNKQIRYVAVDAVSGKPLSGTTLLLKYNRGQNEASTSVTTNKQGEYLFCYKKNPPISVFATTATDKACPPMSVYGQFRFYEGRTSGEYGDIFTDRAIYRPGQTVHAAGLFYKLDNGYEHEVLKNHEVRVSLHDANYKVIAEKTLTTDDYGTVATDFVLPSATLTGYYTIRMNQQAQSLRVEEYKRPTFQVEFDPVAEDYHSGDTLTISGRAMSYAGVPVQGAKVSYRIERRRAWWWFTGLRHHYANDDALRDQQLATGELTTDGEGRFQLPMSLMMPKSENAFFCNFVVTADVTDAAGETHFGELSVPLGNRKTALSIDIEEKMLAEKMVSPTLHLKNAAGNDLIRKVDYQLDGGAWRTTETSTPIHLPRLKSGKHTLKAKYGDETAEESFTVFSLNDKRPAANTDDWFYTSANQFPADGKPVTLQVGSSDKDVHVAYTIVAGNTIIEQGITKLDNELINRKLFYHDSYGNGLALSFVWMKNGKAFQHTTTLRRPLPDKRLNLTWKTFRDRLTPGQQEEWRLTITSADGKPVSAAQMMATLYDKSLDQLESHQWSLTPYINIGLPSLRWNYGQWGDAYFFGSRHVPSLSVMQLDFSHFDRECYPTAGLLFAYGNTRNRRFKTMNIATMDTAEAEGDLLAASQMAIGSYDVEEAKVAAENVAGDEAAMPQQAGKQAETISLRENLKETAFFYPQLTADTAGTVSVRFTLPESLTTWRFMGLAHTQDMKFGMLEGEAVASKTVMILPNMPRFLRIGDKAILAARLFNTTDSMVHATACLELVEPETEAIVYSSTQALDVVPDSTQSVTFDYACREGTGSLLIARFTVSGEGFSDGEQHYLPILPDCEQVTISIPFTQNAPGTKAIDLKKLFPSQPTTANDQRLTIEYTNNPAWFMIQALPALGHPHDDCVVCQAAALYANSIGRHILSQTPQAKHIFEMWRREGPAGSLQSALAKNEELKAVVLSETPWMMDADSEQEQKSKLADFFDESLLDQRINSAAEQLRRLQTASGAWSWWPGMEASFCMTVEVSEMLSRMQKMTGQKELGSDMLRKAYAYLDNEIIKTVNEMKREERKGHPQTFPSHKALQYLYLSALSGRTTPAKVSEAQAYLKKLLKKEVKRQSLYEKALTAIILKSPLYAKSLKEYTVYKEDLGRYYDTPRAGYSWRDYRIPTQVAAIEAMQLLTPHDSTTIDEMRRWLLQEKRAQAWDTPLNSVNAIYAFLNADSQLLAAQPKSVLKVDGKEIPTSQATAGIGYVKAVLPSSGGVAGGSIFTAEKTSTGTSWGTVYAQFLQKTADIKTSQSGISVKRELLVADNASHLSVGDRITVRITIETERDLDFVEVVDKRAACLEPVNPLSGYRQGYYCTPKDNTTNYYFNRLPKGKHIIATEYYIDRKGTYESGSCTATCAYAPEFRGTAPSVTIQTK